MKTTTQSTPWIHPFERAGLGSAPFRVMGYSVEKFQACQGAPIQPGGMCDFCGAGIMHVYRVQGSGAADKPFRTGCDCVARTGDTQLSEAARRARRAEENRIFREAHRAFLAEQDVYKATKRAERAAWNAENMAETIERALVVSECNHVGSFDRKIAGQVYEALTTGETSEVSDFEAGILAVAYPAALLPPSTHVGAVKERLRNVRARYEGGPTIGHDSPWGTSVLGKFRVLDGDNAGAVLVWKTSGHPCARGAIVTLTCTVDRHDEYEGVKQTKVTRCKVTEVTE